MVASSATEKHVILYKLARNSRSGGETFSKKKPPCCSLVITQETITAELLIFEESQ